MTFLVGTDLIYSNWELDSKWQQERDTTTKSCRPAAFQKRRAHVTLSVAVDVDVMLAFSQLSFVFAIRINVSTQPSQSFSECALNKYHYVICCFSFSSQSKSRQ